MCRPARQGHRAHHPPQLSAQRCGSCVTEGTGRTLCFVRFTTASCSRCGSACAGVACPGHRARRSPRLSTQRRGGHVTKDTGCTPLPVPLHDCQAALAAAQRVLARSARDIERTARLDSPRLTSRLPAVLAASARPTPRLPAALAVAQRVPAQPKGHRAHRLPRLSTPHFTIAGCSAELRRLRHEGHRPHAAPRLASRSPAALAAARRALTRPVWDSERTTHRGLRHSVVAAVSHGGHRPRAAPCLSPRLSAAVAAARRVLLRPVRGSGRATRLGSPRLAADWWLPLLWLGVCRLGPSGTQSAPPTSILDSAGLWRLRHG